MVTLLLGASFSRYVCEGANVESYIETFDVPAGRLSAVPAVSCPGSSVNHNLLMSSLLLRLGVASGHHIHGVIINFADGSQYVEILYDDGSHMKLPASASTLGVRFSTRNLSVSKFVKFGLA